MPMSILQRVSIAVVLFLVLVSVTGSGVGLFDENGCKTEVAQSERARGTSPNVGATALGELVSGNSAFAFDLYRVVRDNTKNLFYSPYSISMALAMAYAGARGETERQMAQTLHFTSLQELLHPAFNALDLELARRGQAGQDGEGFRLKLANALWGQLGYPFQSEFLNVLAENYGAGMRTADFRSAPEECRAVINNWVSEQTEGKVKELLPPDLIDQRTRLILTNAIYFKAAWRFSFDTRLTREGQFRRLDGTQVTVPMMRQTGMRRYAQRDGYQAAELLYAGEKFSMVVVLPATGQFESFAGSLDAQTVTAILGSLNIGNLDLTMPKFKYESSFRLKETLSAMGMPEAFSDRANFSGMTSAERLKIGDAVHQAFVSVDEAGTEAAAATGVGAVPTSRPPEVKLDRPFIFLIRDIQTGTVLFVGQVVDPRS